MLLHERIYVLLSEPEQVAHAHHWQPRLLARRVVSYPADGDLELLSDLGRGEKLGCHGTVGLQPED